MNSEKIINVLKSIIKNYRSIGGQTINKNILVVEDDPMTNKVICDFLTEKGYIIFSALDGEIGLDLFQSEKIDLAVLDIMLPKIDGLTVLSEIRKKSAAVPIVMLTAVEDEYTQVVSFGQQVDDYVTKPFSPTILVKRIEAIFRRTAEISYHSSLQYSDVIIDFEAHTVESDEGIIELTKKEYEILGILFRRIGKVVTREQLIEECWGYDYSPSDRIIDTHIKNIRKKISSLKIRTIKGLGYLLENVQ